MAFCGGCGTPAPPEDNYCQRCGRPLTSGDVVQPAPGPTNEPEAIDILTCTSDQFRDYVSEHTLGKQRVTAALEELRSCASHSLHAYQRVIDTYESMNRGAVPFDGALLRVEIDRGIRVFEDRFLPASQAVVDATKAEFQTISIGMNFPSEAQRQEAFRRFSQAIYHIARDEIGDPVQGQSDRVLAILNRIS